MSDRVLNFFDYLIGDEWWRIGALNGDICMTMPLGATVAMKKIERRFRSWNRVEARSLTTDRMAEQINEFLTMGRRGFDVDVFMVGTEFEKMVWMELMRVEYGQRISYGVLANRCGLCGGARAVGGAVGRNPLLLLVPCHRVVASDGSIGGFSAGIDLKRSLLSMENNHGMPW